MQVFGNSSILAECPKSGDLLAIVRRLPEMEAIWNRFYHELGLIGRMWGENNKTNRSNLCGSSIPLICREGTIVIRQCDHGRGPLEVIVHRAEETSLDFEAIVERIWELIKENDWPYVETGSP